MCFLRVGVVLLAVSPLSFAQQQVTVKALDGHNGQPLKNQVIDIWFGSHPEGYPLQAKTGQEGTVAMPLQSEVSTFVVAGEFVSDCRAGNEPPGKSFIDANVYSVGTLLNTGIVAENHCSKVTQKPVPGVLVLFLRPLHWWEKMMGD